MGLPRSLRSLAMTTVENLSTAVVELFLIKSSLFSCHPIPRLRSSVIRRERSEAFGPRSSVLGPLRSSEPLGPRSSVIRRERSEHSYIVPLYIPPSTESITPVK